MAIARTPWLGCFTISDLAVHPLIALLQSLPATQQPTSTLNNAALARSQYLVIGNDPDNGAAKLYVGNETLTTALYGWKLLAGQYIPLYSMDANLIRLDHIYLLFNTQPAVVTVAILAR